MSPQLSTHPLSGNTKVRVASYIFDRLVQAGMTDVFLISGGGAMHLNDAIGRCSGLKYFCFHHEQSCAIAAESYARLMRRPAIVNVTTGPGGVNALNGVFGAWTDSIPMIVVSGQVKRETCLGFHSLPDLRQLGDQEIDIISMVKGITKYAALVREPEEVRFHLEKAIHLASTGRPGPCWLDVPVDIQAAQIDPSALLAFDPDAEPGLWDQKTVSEQVREVLKLIEVAKRPVLMVGSGVHLSGAVALFERAIELLGIPVVTAWTAHDLLPFEHPLFCGRPGTLGDRAGNFVVQNSDLLIVVGSRLNIRQVSYNWDLFARQAYKVQVDIDPAEMEKPTVKIDMKIVSDARFFFQEIVRQLAGAKPGGHREWLEWARQRLMLYPWVLEKHRKAPPGFVNPYHFVDMLFDALSADDVVVCGNGTACVVPFQAAKIKRGQRMYANSGDASMGYDLPAAIGAAVALQGKKRVVCLAGDGSIQLNLQELQTIVHHKLPIKIFVLNNSGYLSIRQTQDAYFGLRVGCGTESGVSFPDIVKIAQVYGLKAERWDSPDKVQERISSALSSLDPVLIELMLDPDQSFEPKLVSKKLPDGKMYSPPLEDMSPFLDAEELRNNMIIDTVEA